MTNDEHLRPWWWMAEDLRAWLRREISEERGPSRAICLADDDRALGRVAVRLPPALDIKMGNAASIRVAERLGATRRIPTRIHTDRERTTEIGA